MFNLESWAPRSLALLRIMTSLLFLQHGLQKIFHFPPSLPPLPGSPAAMAAANEMSPLILSAGWIEIIGGVLIALGLFTRVFAFICSGEMAFAYFMAHSSRSIYPILNNGDEPIIFCFIFLYLAFAGPGSISLDAIIRKKI